MPVVITGDVRPRQMWSVDVSIRDLGTGENLAVSVLGTDCLAVPVSDAVRAEVQQICADAHDRLQAVLMRADT